jgi:hypothetical protein
VEVRRLKTDARRNKFSFSFWHEEQLDWTVTEIGAISRCMDVHLD